MPDTALGDAIVHEAVRRGVLMFVTGRGFLKISPPLNIEPEAVLEAIGVIRDCFLELKDQPV
jgi:4-aminobutyrate aminotransferase-like enzyme